MAAPVTPPAEASSSGSFQSLDVSHAKKWYTMHEWAKEVLHACEGFGLTPAQESSLVDDASTTFWKMVDSDTHDNEIPHTFLDTCRVRRIVDPAERERRHGVHLVHLRKPMYLQLRGRTGKIAVFMD